MQRIRYNLNNCGSALQLAVARPVRGARGMLAFQFGTPQEDTPWLRDARSGYCADDADFCFATGRIPY